MASQLVSNETLHNAQALAVRVENTGQAIEAINKAIEFSLTNEDLEMDALDHHTLAGLLNASNILLENLRSEAGRTYELIDQLEP